MSFKSVLLGCGGRAGGHAFAYGMVKQGTMVACCDLDAARAEALATQFALPRWYTDLDTMLEAERPDLVHLVTRPNLRVGLMTHLSEVGVPGVIVEEPDKTLST